MMVDAMIRCGRDVSKARDCRQSSPTSNMRTGVTILELLTVLSLVGIMSAIAIPSIAAARDRTAVHGATSSLVATLADARHLAQRWHRRTAVTFDTAASRAIVHAGPDTLASLALHALFKVTLGATRDSIAFYPTGLGYGAANTRLIVARGASAETVTVSRAGRVRR
jgi:prepilin-type N-terminal cleavage/methylation domain-containing protein